MKNAINYYYNLFPDNIHQTEKGFYFIVNKIRYMDRYRIVNVFKDWTLFPFELRRDMLDAIFTEFDLDYTLHPYGHKKKNLSKVFSILAKNKFFKFDLTIVGI